MLKYLRRVCGLRRNCPMQGESALYLVPDMLHGAVLIFGRPIPRSLL